MGISCSLNYLCVVKLVQASWLTMDLSKKAQPYHAASGGDNILYSRPYESTLWRRGEEIIDMQQSVKSQCTYKDKSCLCIPVENEHYEEAEEW